MVRLSRRMVSLLPMCRSFLGWVVLSFFQACWVSLLLCLCTLCVLCFVHGAPMRVCLFYVSSGRPVCSVWGTALLYLQLRWYGTLSPYQCATCLLRVVIAHRMFELVLPQPDCPCTVGLWCFCRRVLVLLPLCPLVWCIGFMQQGEYAHCVGEKVVDGLP